MLILEVLKLQQLRAESDYENLVIGNMIGQVRDAKFRTVHICMDGKDTGGTCKNWKDSGENYKNFKVCC